MVFGPEDFLAMNPKRLSVTVIGGGDPQVRFCF